MNRMKTSELMKRFAPYYFKYWKALLFDLFCAALTTLCEIVLPLILRYITNEGMYNLANLTVKTIVTIGLLYFGLRIIDGLANFYMAYTGHIYGGQNRDGYENRRILPFAEAVGQFLQQYKGGADYGPHYKRLV